MKKIVRTILAGLLCAAVFSGCGVSLDGDSSTVHVDKKGAVSSLDVEQLDQEFYDEGELESFVKEAVEEYTQEYGRGTVKVDDITVEDQTAKLQMAYKTAEDYSRFNGIELFAGDVVSSLAAGHTYDVEFARVENGAVVGAATKQDIYAQKDLKAVIIRANTDVQVDGEICYGSCENVKLVGPGSVSIREGYDLGTGAVTAQEDGSFETEVYTFIVYK